ncbi:MAG: hypothetical protein HDT04_02695, partial [Bacteroidales bacterium]|nr:hypothetical protein [Bacteroidales bacterium]
MSPTPKSANRPAKATPRNRHFVFGPELQLGLTMKARIQQTPKQRYRYVPDLCRPFEA